MALSEIEVRELAAQHTAAVRHRVLWAETQRIPGWIRQTVEAVQQAGQQPAGMPYVRSFAVDDAGMDIEVGCPVAEPFRGDGDVQASTLPAGPAAVASYFGPYEQISSAYEAISAWCAAEGHEVVGAPWESYFTDPHEEPDPEKWRTDVHFPVQR